VNSDRVDVPSLICAPTIVKDPKRGPATVPLSDLYELQKNFLSSHFLRSHRGHQYCTDRVQTFDLLLKITIIRSSFLSRQKHIYCEKLALEREKERNKTRKFTIALISVGHLCFYPVCSRKKWDVLQKLLMDIVQ
jgi:hypothetical protein